MRIVSAVISAYYFIIIARVILSWIPSRSEFILKLKQVIHTITDPYMNRFSGISWLRFGAADFSPVLGLLILSFILYVTRSLSVGEIPTLGQLLVLIISMVWGVIEFLILLVAAIMVFRLITLFVMKGDRPGWIDRLDAFLFPRVSRIIGMFTGKTVSYPLALGISAASLAIFWLGIDQLLMRVIYPLIIKL